MKSIHLTSDEITQILAGEKTQCRKVVKPVEDEILKHKKEYSNSISLYADGLLIQNIFPDYKVNEIIYCKEPWKIVTHAMKKQFSVVFSDDSNMGVITNYAYYCTHNTMQPAITMSECFSRCKIRITDIKCERLQDISFLDCNREGYKSIYSTDGMYLPEKRRFIYGWERNNPNTKWESNPWCFVYSFEKIEVSK
jgi:hypothetical protein